MGLLGHDHAHGHGHHHGHDHRGHVHAHGDDGAIDRLGERRRLTLTLVLTGTILIAEVVGGLLSGSLALLSDAGHMLTDLSAQVLSLLALVFASRPPDARRSYGFYRLEILAALANGAVLLALSGYLIYESVQRVMHPHPVDTSIMLPIAAVGLVANLAGVFILRHARSLNVRSAYLHILSDTMASFAVIVGGLAMWALQGGWAIDAVLSGIIALLIVHSGYRLLRDSVDVLLEAVPRGVDPARVVSDIGRLEGVREVHDLHIWTITSGMFALSAHIVVDEPLNGGCQMHDDLISDVQRMLERDHKIMHSTLQIESPAHEHVSGIH